MQLSNDPKINDKKLSRRRKKRRTEVSSDEESSSSSSSSSSDDDDEEEDADIEPSQRSQVNNGNALDTTMRNDVKPNSNNVTDELNAAIHARLTQVPFNTQDSVINDSIKDQDKDNLVTKHSKDRGEMDKKFMQLMTEQFGDQLNELRKDPSFSNKSLMVLAQSLQSSSNIFDDEEINKLINRD